MGITGLLPFLEKSSRKTNISEFSGKTVAIDTYCWLHKGAFSCADKIIMGQPTDAYVKYCMKFVNMLLGHNIKPILVFDGRHLPAKAETEVKRRESREANKKRAADLIKMGKIYEGKNLLRRSLDVSHKMALEVIKECQAHNVDCIVAPYEADAQLAYLNISGIADVVITEDSDLTLFGCSKIFFKMDLYGYGVLVEQDRLYLAMGLSLSNFHIDKFRYMCILSGCDYLASLPGIGLGKACKFIVKNTDDDIYNALQRLASSLNMKSLAVTKEYRDNFMRALVTFKHQLVYCPLQRKQVRLHPPTPEVTSEQLICAGAEVDPQLAWELALGNCDPFTYTKLHNFNPDEPRQLRSNAWSEIAVAKHQSIWSKNFTIKETKPKVISQKNDKELPARITSTCGQVAILKTDILKKQLTPRKRTLEVVECETSLDEIIKLYKEEPKPQKELTQQLPTKTNLNVSSSDEQTSPTLVRRSNPFIKPSETSPSLLSRIRKRLPVKSRLRPTIIDETVIAQSKFFAAESKNEDKEEELMDVIESMAVNVDEEDYKENMNFDSPKVVIPETEPFESVKEDEDADKDSGYKGSSDGDINISAMSCDDSFTEKEPLHTVDNISEQKHIIEEEIFRRKFEKEEKNEIFISEEQEMDFSITREIFSEAKSSLFKYDSPIAEKKIKRHNSFAQSTSKLSQSQGSSFRRSIRNNSKKTAIIQGQQSLLNMFGFQKK